MKTIIALLGRLTDLLCREPVKAAGIKLGLADALADFIARRITDLEDAIRHLRDNRVLCDRAADLAYAELEREELNALLREHREFLDREAVVREELDHLGEVIQKIEVELARRVAL